MSVGLPERWHTLLHILWTKAVGTTDYSRDEWQELERVLEDAARIERVNRSIEQRVSERREEMH